MSRLIACMTLLLLLSACGNKGPLYLPEEAPPSSGDPLELLKKKQR